MSAKIWLSELSCVSLEPLHWLLLCWIHLLWNLTGDYGLEWSAGICCNVQSVRVHAVIRGGREKPTDPWLKGSWKEAEWNWRDWNAAENCAILHRPLFRYPFSSSLDFLSNSLGHHSAWVYQQQIADKWISRTSDTNLVECTWEMRLKFVWLELWRRCSIWNWRRCAERRKWPYSTRSPSSPSDGPFAECSPLPLLKFCSTLLLDNNSPSNHGQCWIFFRDPWVYLKLHLLGDLCKLAGTVFRFFKTLWVSLWI